MKKFMAIIAGLLMASFVVYAGSGIEDYDDATTVQDAIQIKLVDDLTELFAAVAAITTGSGVVVSTDDTTAGVLDGKLVAGEGIDYTVNNPAGNESMTIDVETATTTNPGIIETATDAEALALTVTDKIVTPGNLGALMASDAETLTGTLTNRAITPANLKSMILDEDDMASDLATKVASQQSIKAYVAANSPAGLVVRSKFRWKSVTEIYIGSGEYHHEGTTDQKVYWDSELTYTVLTNGAPDWVYIYIDDSAVVTLGTNLLTNAEFIDNTTEPTWSPTKKGYYTGSDRAIYAVYLVANDVVEFSHEGNTVFHADAIENQAAVDIDTAWTDIGALIIPKFTTIGVVNFVQSVASTGWSWRTNGQTGATGHFIMQGTGIIERRGSEVITDSSQIIEVKATTSDTSQIACNTEGWRFPIGM